MNRKCSILVLGILLLLAGCSQRSDLQTMDFIIANPIDFSQIRSISKFRSCIGHDYSGTNVEGEDEQQRSMKHYLGPIASLSGTIDQVKVFAPFDGEIEKIGQEQNSRGNQVWLKKNAAQDWVFVFFHINLLPSFEKGSPIRAGDLLGYADLSKNAHNFDFGLKKFAIFKQIFDSPFHHMSSSVLKQYEERGITVDTVIIPKEVRDANPCDFNNFYGDDFVMLNELV